MRTTIQTLQSHAISVAALSQLKVLYAVIRFITVYVMNGFVLGQRPIEMVRHYCSMFQNITAFLRHLLAEFTRDSPVNANVAIGQNFAFLQVYTQLRPDAYIVQNRDDFGQANTHLINNLADRHTLNVKTLNAVNFLIGEMTKVVFALRSHLSATIQDVITDCYQVHAKFFGKIRSFLARKVSPGNFFLFVNRVLTVGDVQSNSFEQPRNRSGSGVNRLGYLHNTLSILKSLDYVLRFKKGFVGHRYIIPQVPIFSIT